MPADFPDTETTVKPMDNLAFLRAQVITLLGHPAVLRQLNPNEKVNIFIILQVMV